MKNLKVTDRSLPECLEILNSIASMDAVILTTFFVKSESDFKSLFEGNEFDTFAVEKELDSLGDATYKTNCRQEFHKGAIPIKKFHRNGTKNSILYSYGYGDMVVKNYIPFGTDLFFNQDEEETFLVSIYTRKDAEFSEVRIFKTLSTANYIALYGLMAYQKNVLG